MPPTWNITLGCCVKNDYDNMEEVKTDSRDLVKKIVMLTCQGLRSLADARARVLFECLVCVNSKEKLRFSLKHNCWHNWQNLCLPELLNIQAGTF